MTDKLDDLDLDDVQGNIISSKKKTPLIKIASEIPGGLRSEEIEWNACIERLEEHCKKTWVCLPQIDTNNKLCISTGEIKECSSNLFFKWLCYVYPPAKNMKHSASDYDKTEFREKAFFNIVNIVTSMKFPLGSLTPIKRKKEDK